MSLAGKKTKAAPFSNHGELVRVRYDFSVDGGALGDYDVLEADGDIIVQMIAADVKTAVTSGGALVADLGKGDGGTEFWSDKGKAALTLDAIVGPDTAESAFVELADGEKVVLGIEGDTATAGVVEFLFMVYSR